MAWPMLGGGVIAAMAGGSLVWMLWRVGAVPAGFAPQPPVWAPIAAAAAGVFLWAIFGPHAPAAVGAILWPLCALLVGAATDRERGVLLNRVAALGVVGGLVLAAIAGELPRAAAGAAWPAAVFGAFNLAAASFGRRTELWGWGDVKAAPLAGLALGPTMGTICVALAIVMSGTRIWLTHRRSVVGPYLAATALGLLFLEQEVGGTIMGAV